MKRLIHIFLLLIASLGACSQVIAPTETLSLVIETSTRSTPKIQTPTILPPLSVTLTPGPISTPTFMHLEQSIVDMPIATPAYKQCGSASPQRVFAIEYIVYDAMKMLDPIADGFAETIDRGCVDFGGKEFTYAVAIYFYIDNKFAADLNDYETLGSWIVDVMNLLDTIPRDEYTRYAEPTNAIFTFYADNSESLEVIVHIQEYWTKAHGKSGEEVFDMFYAVP